MEKFKLYDQVKLKYNPEDLDDEDLGMSGIVLKSPLNQFKGKLDYTFVYRGTMLENEEKAFISVYFSDTTSDRIYLINKMYLELAE